MHRAALWLLDLGAVCCFLLLVALLAGCNRSQPQVIADTRAAALAAGAMPDGPARQALYEAIGRSVVAMTDDLPGLPAPTWTPEEIKVDPGAFIDATADSVAEPPPHEPIAPPVPPAPGMRDRLAEEGERLIAWGKWAAIAGGALSLLGWAYGLFGWTFLGWVGRLILSPLLSPIFRLAASLGTASVGLGAAMVWLAANWWIFLGAVLAIGTGIAIYHHRDIAKAWDRTRAAWTRFRTPAKPKV